MRAYASGRGGEFEQFYSRHLTRLYRFLLRQLRDGALADDLFQDVWQRMIAARAGWTPDASFASWLYRIAHNRIADHWLEQQYRPPAPENAHGRTARTPDPDTPTPKLTALKQTRGAEPSSEEHKPEHP